MKITNKLTWSLGVLAVTVVMAMSDIICHSRHRKLRKRETTEQLHEWENEGGALPPPKLDAPTTKFT